MSTYQEERVPFPSPWRLVKELRLRRPPWWLVALLLLVVIGTWIPLTLIYQARQQTSRLPRIHFFHDMDHQPKFGPQAAASLVCRWPLHASTDREAPLLAECWSTTRSICWAMSHKMEPEPRRRLDLLLPCPNGCPQIVICSEQRPRAIWYLLCALSRSGRRTGNGPINQAALALKEGKWVAATNLMTQMIRDRADGQLFQAISDGVRSMPSYSSQISVRDRWAIVAYVRELQQTLPVAAEPQEPSGAALRKCIHYSIH
jgi:hypothetical protein